MAQEKAARFSPGEFESLRPEMLPGFLRQKDIHLYEPNLFRDSAKNIPPPLGGGDRGDGDVFFIITLSPTLSRLGRGELLFLQFIDNPG